MDISKRVIITFCIILFIFITLNFAFVFTQEKQLIRARELEQNETLKNVERIQNAVFIQQGYLDYVVQDWACWDDTYRFIDDRNPDFIDVDLQNQTLAGVKVNVMIFVNNTGNVVYARAVDIDTAEEIPVPQELLKMVEDGKLLTKSENETIKGFVLLNKDPMFISCHPILTTEYKGPMKGTLILGRYFDKTLLKYLEDVTNTTLVMYRVDKDMPPDFQTKLNIFNNSSTDKLSEVITTPNESAVGYIELKDIKKQSAFLIKAEFPSYIYTAIKGILNYMYAFLVLAEFLFLLGFWVIQVLPFFDG